MSTHRQKVASMSKDTKQFTQYLRQENPDYNKSLNQYIVSRRVFRNCMPFVRGKKKCCVVTQYQCSNLFYGVTMAQVAQAAGEKVGKAKEEKKCNQFIVLYRCCSRYCNALECVDGGETHFVLPL